VYFVCLSCNLLSFFYPQNTRSLTTDVLIGSKLFIADGKKTTDRYRNITAMYFYNSVGHVPFTNPAVAVDQINDWASRSTKGNVPSIITPGELHLVLHFVFSGLSIDPTTPLKCIKLRPVRSSHLPNKMY